MEGTLNETQWETLLSRIENGDCIPFLGAGACADYIPTAAKIAGDWAAECAYPLRNPNDLSQVAQYLAVTGGDYVAVKEKLLRDCIHDHPSPDFEGPCEIHGTLARLPIPLYVTTNYDDSMYDALEHFRGRAPRRRVCPWYLRPRDRPAVIEDAEATPDDPIVYHLHGWRGDPGSLVLTEDDYLEFLVQVSEEPTPIHPQVQDALGRKSLLFIGYSLTDWNVRVLFRGLRQASRCTSQRSSITVQLRPTGPDDSAETRQRVEEYLVAYFDQMNVHVCWQRANDFAEALLTRWKERSDGVPD